MKKALPMLLFWITTICLVGCILLSQDISAGISQGIHICLNSLIPSLYFFMILSNIIMNTSLCRVLARPFRLFSRRVLKLNDKLFVIFLLSLLGGYPVGAKLIGDQLKEHRISVKTGQRMMMFCVNCSPAFLICYLSLYLWDSMVIGVILYLSQVLAALLMAVLSGFRYPIPKQVPAAQGSQQDTLSAVFVSSVNQATHTMGIICSFVVTFCAAFPILDHFLSDGKLSLAIKGLLEVTAGCQGLASVSFLSSVLGAALFTSFGGVCVFLQITAIVIKSGISIWRWILSRILYTALSVLFAYLGFLLVRPTADCFVGNAAPLPAKWFTTSPAASFCMVLLAGMLLFVSVPSGRKRKEKHSACDSR